MIIVCISMCLYMCVPMCICMHMLWCMYEASGFQYLQNWRSRGPKLSRIQKNMNCAISNFWVFREPQIPRIHGYPKLRSLRRKNIGSAVEGLQQTFFWIRSFWDTLILWIHFGYGLDTLWIRFGYRGLNLDMLWIRAFWIHCGNILNTFWIRIILDTLWMRCSHYPDHTSQAIITKIERESPLAVFSPKLAKTD